MSSFSKDFFEKCDCIVITLEGNIGAGKSTLASNIKENNKLNVYSEPVQIWRNFGNINFLENFYKDPSKHGLYMQSLISLSMIPNHVHNECKGIRVLDRSFISVTPFLNVAKDMGNLTQEEFDLLINWNELISAKYADFLKIDYIIYLDNTPETSYERVKKRNRNEESDMPLDYLIKIDKYTREFIESLNNKIKIITLNANEDSNVLYEKFNEFLLTL